jgi:hypothetical protein
VNVQPISRLTLATGGFVERPGTALAVGDVYMTRKLLSASCSRKLL